MTLEERIANMTKAINRAIKVMGDRFGSTEQEVARTVQELKASIQTSPSPALQPLESALNVPRV